MSELSYRDNMHNPTKTHPMCSFIECFPSSNDPYTTHYELTICHMVEHHAPSEICNGDYMKCPIKNMIGNVYIALEESK